MASSSSASSITTRHPETEVAVERNQPSASTYTPALRRNNDYYQIFINHRGPDVKKTLASSLYHSLDRLGLKVFLDKEEMQEGENISRQIEGAIRSASVQVAIFSPGYADSKWCLDELVLMRETGSTIIPVFYHVNPSDLKWKQGLYAKALQNLATKKTDEDKPRYDSETIKNWRNALFHVAEISGFELESFNGDEGELVDKVVKRVQEKLEKIIFTVAEYPYGVDEKVEDFEKTVLLQQQQNGKPLVVGIVGMGGVGKTTLAKELSNKNSSCYSKSCFLWNENRDKNSLQRKLYQRLTGSDLGTDNIDEAIEKLKVHSKFQAFVILDGADDKDQVVAVFAFKTVLSSDSLILITSTDRDVLTSSGVQNSLIYKLTGLNTQHSREVFCSQAFNQPHPFTGFESLVDEYLNACEGLPLSLNVLGASLRGKEDKRDWKDRLKGLQQKLPSEIEKTLKISYDGLDTEEKEIFLDIASFFIGEKRDMAIKIWDGSGWNGRKTFQSLQNKSLVEVDSEKKIKMHNHLRDMGRNEASGLPHRLWHWTEHIDDLLLQLRNDQVRGLRTASDHVSTEVRGVSLACYHGSGHESKPNKQENRKLQLLDVEGADARILEKLHSTNLIWLRWRNCSDSCLPDWVPIHNLRVLEVNSSILKKLWKKKSQAPLELRELVITSPLSELPKSIGELKHLELISLKCSLGNVKTLPKEFCDLQSLIRLELTNCSEIKSLPVSFGCLTKLEHIDLSGSKRLERLPDSFYLLLSLKVIKLRDCSEIKLLPDSMGKLTNLEHIDLSGSKNLERLPKSFGDLIRLKYLDLSRCNNLTIDNNTLENIKTLEYINLSDCQKIGLLPLQVAHQRSLKELYFPFLEMVPSLQYVNLKELKLRNGSYSKVLECLPIPVEVLPQLAKLRVYECEFLEQPFEKNEGAIQLSGERTSSNVSSSIDMSKLVQLQYIELYKTNISEVSFTDGFCPKLQHLVINSCNHLVKVGTLPDALVKLELTRCNKLKKIEGLCGLANLQTLNIKLCRQLEELSNLETLESLEVFNVSECGKVKRIEGLAQLTKLRLLDIIKCSELEELPGVEHLMSLQWLDATGCPKLQWSEEIVEQLRKRQLAKLNLGKGLSVSSQKS